MLAFHRRTVAAAAVALGLVTLVPAARAQTSVDDAALARALRAGGYVILVRHGATYTDTDPLNFHNVGAQRQLSDRGRARARAFGDALREAGVPIGRVYTSTYNRAYETATLAGFKNAEKIVDLTEGGMIISPDEEDRRAEALRKMLATPPLPGTNTLLVTHKPNLIDALGDDWFGVKEGEASIFRPENGTYVLVARVQMSDWPRIAKVATH
jgi:broad specificity phosphatase PhoE